MEFTITCHSLQELKETVDRLYILFPEEEQEVEQKVEQKKKKGLKRKIDRDKVRALMEKGMTNKQIASEMGCAYSSICNVVTEINEGGGSK